MNPKQTYNLYKVILFAIIAAGLILSLTTVWVSPINDAIINLAFGLIGIVYIVDNREKKKRGEKENKAEYVYGAFFIFYSFSQFAYLFV